MKKQFLTERQVKQISEMFLFGITNRIAYKTEDEIVLDTKGAFKAFDHIGGGVESVRTESHYSSEVDFYTNTAYIVFDDSDYGYIKKEEWDEVAEICKELIEFGEIEDYIIKSSQNKLELEFDSDMPLVEK